MRFSEMLVGVWLTAFPLLAQDQALGRILDSLGRHAESFRRVAPFVITDETLEQRSRATRPGAAYDTHEVVSEYGFAAMANAPLTIHEIRKVVSVDGKQVTTLGKAREAMTLGLRSADDKLKKRLLEDFEKHGLRGAATDFGQVILLFSARHQNDYVFELRGERQIGAERLLVLRYTQKTGDSGMTVFLGNTANREPLHGEISIRKTDLVPLRVSMTSVQTARGVQVREESTVEYKYDRAGSVLPVSVVHREFVANQLATENQFSYAPFRQLGN